MKIKKLSLYLLVLTLLTACAGQAVPAAPTTNLPAATTTALPPTATTTVAPTATPTPYPTEVPFIPSEPVSPVLGAPKGTNGFPWWNDAVFYEIFVRSFADSDGNGIGDFNGITEKLDYLNDGDPNTETDLGITGLWLMPIHPSPSYHGYDVIDYYEVNPDFGTMEDFKRLLAEAHKRGIQVSIDMVLNHTSTRNEWFEAAQDVNSPFRDWYRWQTGRPTSPGWQPGGGGAFYYAFFTTTMPDLNYENPAVREEMKKVARFWLTDVGVDGFRLDAAKHIYEDGAVNENLPSTHAWWAEYRTFLKSVNPNAFTVGEVWDDNDTLATYLAGDQLDLAFAFDQARDLVYTAGTGTARYANTAIAKTNQALAGQQFASFLTNHDQDRVMSVLNGNLEDAKIAATLLLTIPGVPFIYYGEEIGQLGKKPDENLRLPMQWSAEPGAGFTNGKAWKSPNSDFITRNVEAQLADPNSLLSLYRALIQLRNDHEALRVGETIMVATPAIGLVSHLRVSQNEAVLVLINTAHSGISDYFLRGYGAGLTGEYTLTPLMGTSAAFPNITFDEQGNFEVRTGLPVLPVGSRIILQLKKEP